MGSLIKRRQNNEQKNESMQPVDVRTHEWGTSSMGTSICLDNALNGKEYEKIFAFGFENMKRREINMRNMLLFLICFPVISCVVQLWIHWQAFKIYWKGIPIQPHPRQKYVNPCVFWIKHSVIFIIAIVAKV